MILCTLGYSESKNLIFGGYTKKQECLVNLAVIH